LDCYQRVKSASLIETSDDTKERRIPKKAFGRIDVESPPKASVTGKRVRTPMSKERVKKRTTVVDERGKMSRIMLDLMLPLEIINSHSDVTGVSSL